MILRILAAAGAAVVVVAGVGAYLVRSTAASASAAQTEAAALLKTVESDTIEIDSSLEQPKLPDIVPSSPHPDFKGAKQTLNDFVTRIDHTRGTVAADLARLRSTEDELRAESSNPLALRSSRSALDHQRRQVASMRSALNEADAALAIERDQARTVSALSDAFDDLATMFDRFSRSDFVGGVAMFSGLDAKLQTAAELARSPSNPVQLEVGISNLRTLLGDLQSYLQALERNDRGAVRSLNTKLDADTKALDSLNPSSLDSYERALVQPHRDRYLVDLKAAGFTPVPNGGGSAI